MTERVLTRDELHAAYRAGGPEGLTHYERLALVEAAVLAKIALKVDTVPRDVAAIVGKLKVDMERAICRDHVTEREARRREREAFRLGAALHGASAGWAADRCNERYPLPTCDKCGQELP